MENNYNENEKTQSSAPEFTSAPDPTPIPTPIPTPMPTPMPTPAQAPFSGIDGFTASLDKIGDGFIATMRGFMPKLQGMSNSAVRQGALKINLLLTVITLLFFYIFPSFNAVPMSTANTIFVSSNIVDLVEDTKEFEKIKDLDKDDLMIDELWPMYKKAFKVYDGAKIYLLFGKLTIWALVINMLLCLYTLITDKIIPFITSRVVSAVAFVMMFLMFISNCSFISNANKLVKMYNNFAYNEDMPFGSLPTVDVKLASNYIFIILASTLLVAFTGFLVSPKRE